MKKLSIAILLIVFLICPTLLFAAEKGRKEQVKDIYAYAYATNFQDSVVYLSAMQKIDGATLHKKYGFLNGRSAYSTQFKNHVEIVQDVRNVVSAVIFSTKKDVLKKKYQKMIKRIKKGSNMFIKEFSADEFYFIPVEDTDDGLRIID